jgi:hypothetical protein
LYVTDRACLSVARTIRLPLPVAIQSATRLRSGSDPVRSIGLPIGGRAQFELPMRRDEWHPVARPDLAPARTFGALYRRGNRRVCTIEIELAPWSDDVTELLVRPAVRSPYRWGDQRLARWFEHAHAAADTLRGALIAHSVVVCSEEEREPVAV